MIAKTIVRGWIIFFSIVFVFAGFLWVKEGGLHKPRPIETETITEVGPPQTDERKDQPQPITVEEPKPSQSDANEPEPEAVAVEEDVEPQAPAQQQPAEETDSQEEVEPTAAPKFETVLPPVTLPIDVRASIPDACKLGLKSAIAEQQFNEASKRHILKVAANTTLTVPFPAEIMKVYETVQSVLFLELKSRDGKRALSLGGFSKTLQTMRFTQPLECGDHLPSLAEDQTLYVQLRNVEGQEWWQGEIIDPAELFN